MIGLNTLSVLAKKKKFEILSTISDANERATSETNLTTTARETKTITTRSTTTEIELKPTISEPTIITI